MAHELEVVNGEASFLEVGARRSAWHQLGHLLPTPPANTEALYAAAPWLDYEVEKVPTYRMWGGDTIQNREAFVTVRTDTGTELGAVGRGYAPISNREAIDGSIAPLIDSGILRVETGGVLREGRDAWVLGRLDTERFGPIVREVFADEIVPYVLAAMNHSGRRVNTLALTPIRVVCANTLGIAESRMIAGRNSVGIRHTGDAGTRTVEAAQRLLGGLIERSEAVADTYRKLRLTRLDLAAFRALVLLPAIGEHPTHRPEKKWTAAAVARYEARAGELVAYWTGGRGHKGDQSAWEAYNGVVEAIDHDATLFPTASDEGRIASLAHGRLRAKKDAVLRSLTSHGRLGRTLAAEPAFDAPAKLTLPA